MISLPETYRKILLNDSTSKINKLWLAIGFKDKGYFVEYDWNCETVKGFKDSVKFRFEPDGKWFASKSFDELYQSMKENERS